MIPPRPATPLRLGVIGGSIRSAVGYTHWAASQLDGCWQVVSGCFSRNPEICRETGRAFQLPQEALFCDWQTYIREQGPALDAVVVLTPSTAHVEIVCALLRAGIAVICEKAMVANVAESQQVKAALEASGTFLAVTFNYSGYPMLRVLRRHVQAGDLGPLLQLQIEMPSDAFIQPPERMQPQAWRLADGVIPTILLDLGVHLHHLAGFVSGQKPRMVTADFHHMGAFAEVVDDAYLWLEYEQGMRASFWLSKAALGHRNGLRLRLYGEQGSAEWLQEEPERLHLFQKTSRRLTLDRANCSYPEEIRERFKAGHPGGFVEAFANLYGDLAAALVQHRETGRVQSPYVFGWEHADEGLRLLQTAAMAHQQRQWLEVAA